MEQTAKEQFIKIIREQPDDTTAEEILKELVFHRMTLRGLKDSEGGHIIPHEEMGRRIESWVKK